MQHTHSGFFAQGKLKKVEVSGGKSAQVLCDAPHGRGGTWNRDGVIVFTPEVWVGLYRVSADGGTPVEITKPDASRFEQSHRWPTFLPDGRHFLYLAANFTGQYEKNTVYVGSLESSEKRPVVQTNANAAYVEPGYLLYLRDKALVAQKFDAHNYVLSGEARIINDEVQYLSQIDLALFAVAGPKTLLIQTGKGADKSQLLWFDRSGKPIGTVGVAGQIANPSLSPDGGRVAFDETDKDGRHQDIWIRELAKDSVMRLTFGPGQNELPVWSPDGRRVVFQGNRNLSTGFYQKSADGSGAEQQIGKATPNQQGLWEWSRDSKYMLIWHEGELWYMSWPSQELKPLFKENWIVRNAQFSPDGKWISYFSDKSGEYKLYIAPQDGLAAPREITLQHPSHYYTASWSPDSKKILFTDTNLQVWVLDAK